MTPAELRALISRGETLDVEFKGEERGLLSDRELLEEIVCLSNRPSSASGWLLVGVEDDGRITGARPRHEAGITDPIRIQAYVANNTRPAIAVHADILVIEDRQVLAIAVPAARSPVATAQARYIRRTIGGDGRPACVPFLYHEMESRQADVGRLDYSARPVEGVSWEHLDPLEFQRLRRRIRESRGDESLLALTDVEIAKALGAVEANHEVQRVRVLGLLLFGREDVLRRDLPTHQVAFQVLGDGSPQVEVNDFFAWPLLRVLEELESRIRASNREREVMFGLIRIGIPDYSPRALREALANALIHRDYTRLGAVHFQWHSDGIIISNPGGLPEGVRLDNLLVTPPRPRNPLLADAFKRIGIVERTARGIDAIFYEQLRNGRPAPSYGRTTGTDVVVVLPGGPESLEFARLVAEEERAGLALNLDDLLLLNHLWLERRLRSTEAASLIQKPDAEARARLLKLVEGGLVEARGQARGRSWHLSATTYRRLGEKAAYVRQRVFEVLQQEQMILQYVETHHRITRREAAELCRIGPLEAGRMLRRLASEGKLHLRGQRRGAHYVSAD